MPSELERMWEELASQDLVVKTAAPTDPKEVGGNVATDSLQMAADFLQKLQGVLSNPPIAAEPEPANPTGDPAAQAGEVVGAGGPAPNGVPGQSVRFEVPAGLTVKVASQNDALAFFGSLGLME